MDAARREFKEETGLVPIEPFHSLGSIRHKSGKIVHAWAFEGDCNPATIKSNTFTMEWPRHSGQIREFPEIDRAAFFTLEDAHQKILPAEMPFLDAITKLPVASEVSSAKPDRFPQTLFDF